MIEARALLRRLFDAAVAAADPAHVVPSHLPAAPAGRLIVLGAGKASAAMAHAVEDNWEGPLDGLVVTRYGHGVPCERIEIVEAAHPVPDRAGVEAARCILGYAQAAGGDDLVMCLISGGGSALLTLPAPGLSLADKQAVNAALLASGAAIGKINTVRKHLSAIKGGRLAAATVPAALLSLVISDVPGDDPAVIASGPTVPDPTTLADARAVLAKYDIEPPATVRARLDVPEAETPKPGDPAFARSETRLIATPRASLEAAARTARGVGLTPIVLGDTVEGEARTVGAAHARQALDYAADTRATRPAVLLSGGETTVTLGSDPGRGGPNAEYALAAALELDGAAGIAVIACDTDGIDGTENNAGALVLPDTLARIHAAGLDPEAALAAHDAYGAFAEVDGLVVTGPTRTNVNDFRAILVP